MIPPCINHHDHTYVKFQRRVSIVYDIIDIGLTQLIEFFYATSYDSQQQSPID